MVFKKLFFCKLEHMLGLSISIGLVGHLLGGSFLISLFYLKLKHKLLPGERLVEDGG